MIRHARLVRVLAESSVRTRRARESRVFRSVCNRVVPAEPQNRIDRSTWVGRNIPAQREMGLR